MSVFVQEVLSLLKRNFVKTTLNPTDDYFQFVRKGPLARAKASAGGFAPQGQSLLISAGSWLCSQTGPNGLGRFARVQKSSGNVSYVPVFTTPEGQCSWNTLKDSIITQDTGAPSVYIGKVGGASEFHVYGKAFVSSLTNREVMLAAQDGLLSGSKELTFGPRPGTAGTYLENRVSTIFGLQNTTINPPCFPPQSSFTLWSRLNLYGSVHFQGTNGDGSEGQIMVQTTCGRIRWEDKGSPPLQFGELIIGYQNPQPAPGTIVPAVGSFTSGALGTGNNNDVLTSGGPGGFPSWAPNPGINGSGTPFRLSAFNTSNTLIDSLLVQDNNLPIVDPSFATQTITNSGYLKLNVVDQLNNVEKVMVWDDIGTSTAVPPFSDKNQVKFRDANSIGLTGNATLRRVPLWSPDGLNLQSSLLIQSAMIQPPANYPVVDPNFIAQILTNNGSFINEGILTLKTVVNDNDLLKILVLSADDEVKYRDLSSLPFGPGTIGGGGTHKRLPLWTPNGTTIKDSLLSQDNDVQPGSGGFSAQVLTNDGSLQQTREIFLDAVPQDDTLTEVLVRDPASANQVKFRNVTTIAPSVGFDTLTMSTTANWTQTFLNAYIALDDTTVPFRSIQGMTTLTDGQTGVVIAENVKTGTLLADNTIRFPNGWGTVGNLYDNRISWVGGSFNGYPTSTLLYGESLKFKYHNYEIAGGGFAYKYRLYWESCCKLYSLNTCPVASNANFTANEDNAISNTVTAVDDGYGGYTGVYTASALANPAAGTLVFNSSTGAFVFTPTANFNGSTTFTFTYNDGYCNSNTATVTLNILPVADPPIWTSTDPVTANTYPNLTGGNAWTYTWTTADADHPCSALTYVITVNDGTGAVEIYPTSGSSWLTFTPDPNNNCTGTLAGTYPVTGGDFDVIMTVTDPDPNSDTQQFTIGGLTVTKDTYFVFTSDTSGSMNSTISRTAKMNSVPLVRSLSNGVAGTTLTLTNGGFPGRVDATYGDTSFAFLCVVPGMAVSGNGIAAGTTVVSVGTVISQNLSIVLSQAHTSSSGNTITFTLTQAQKTADYNSATNFRNLLQDFYATGATASNGNTNTATNGQDFYDSHLYWYHNGQERPLGYLGFQAQGGSTVATIGPTGYFPDADHIVVTAWADESGGGINTYKASPSETGADTWNDRANTTVSVLTQDSAITNSFIAALEVAAGNNTIYRGIAFRVTSGANNDLEEIMGPNGFAQTGGRTANGYSNSFLPEALAYNVGSTSLYNYSNSSPKRITYEGNVTAGSTESYYYALVKTELNAIGFNL